MIDVKTRPARAVQGLAIQTGREDVRMGKDILELLSTALYVDPLVVYREYVQNAADSIDAATSAGLYPAGDGGRVSVTIDPANRNLRIRDNGTGLNPEVFVERMLALGGSAKRGTSARGFRGVGRLAGLGHAQDLIFRSRAPGQTDISVARWDGRILKSALSDGAFEGDVADLISKVVLLDRVPASDEADAHFFEVELSRIVRGRSDRLLSPEGAADYLSEVAPLPFRDDFPYGAEISEKLREAGGCAELDIRINGGEPLRRPHGAAVEIGGRQSAYEKLQIVAIPAQDGGERPAAIGWFLHHGYEGALTVGTRVKGLRLRSGNLQVGDGAILENIFPDPRFNSWTVGEVHLLDPRITPNGRRDQFEANIHYLNLQNHLAPAAKGIIERCRMNSARRSRLRELDLIRNEVEQHLGIVEQGVLGEAAREATLATVDLALDRMSRISEQLFEPSEPSVPKESLTSLRSAVDSARGRAQASDPLAHLDEAEQAFYRRMTEVIYAHSVNRPAAKAMIDRIIEGEIRQASAA